MLPLLGLLTVHFVGDFLLQSNWMAINKSKRFDALTLHAAIYAACFFFWGPVFVLMTFGTHFLTDAVTSRVTAKLWFVNTTKSPFRLNISGAKQHDSLWFVEYDDRKRHWFFVVIGFDQLIHVWTLALTFWWLFE